MDLNSHLLIQNEIKSELICTVCLYTTFQHVLRLITTHLLLDMSNPALWEVQISANVKTKKKPCLSMVPPIFPFFFVLYIIFECQKNWCIHNFTRLKNIGKCWQKTTTFLQYTLTTAVVVILFPFQTCQEQIGLQQKCCPLFQGCGLRTITSSPKVPNHEIRAAQHLSLNEKTEVFPVTQRQKFVTCGTWALLEHSHGSPFLGLKSLGMNTGFRGNVFPRR